jgi:hypothetical protein
MQAAQNTGNPEARNTGRHLKHERNFIGHNTN